MSYPVIIIKLLTMLYSVVIAFLHGSDLNCFTGPFCIHLINMSLIQLRKSHSSLVLCGGIHLNILLGSNIYNSIFRCIHSVVVITLTVFVGAMGILNIVKSEMLMTALLIAVLNVDPDVRV